MHHFGKPVRASVLLSASFARSGLDRNLANKELRVANFHIKVSHQLSYGTVHV